MATYGPPWKLALIGAVAIVAGGALLRLDWTLPQLVAFTAMLLLARGALHVVTTSFAGIAGGLATLQGVVEMGVGVVLLAWPDPTLFVLTVFVGVLAIAQGTIDLTLVLATRNDRPAWAVSVVADLGQIAIGIALVAVRTPTLRTAAVLLGALAIVAGAHEVVIALERGRAARRARAAEPPPRGAAPGLQRDQRSAPAV